MMKRKFSDFLWAKTDTAMVNAALARVLCHNLVVLIRESFKLGIKPILEALSADASEPAR